MAHKKQTKQTKIHKESLPGYEWETFGGTGKRLKKGSVLVVSPWLMHRNSRYWEDPHMFNPHRFDASEKIHKHSYFPFGMGERICIGHTFAMQEAVLLLANILKEYKLELKANFTPDIVGRLTTRSMNGMPIKLTKRETKS